MRALGLAVSVFALAALAQGIALDTSRRLALVDCPVLGGDGGALHAGSLREGVYLFRVTGEQVNLCFHDAGTSFTGTLPDAGTYSSSYPTGCLDGGVCWTCGTGRGEPFSNGTTFLWSIPRGGQAFSCSSAADGGDATWTRAY